MARDLTIWRIVQNDTQVRIYFEPTRAKALARFDQVQRDLRADGYDIEGATCSIESLSYPSTRAGLAAALNDLLSETCYNEG